MKNYCAILLAEQDGSAFHSAQPAAAQELLFQPLLHWALDNCRAAGIQDLCVYVGKERAVEPLLQDQGVSLARYVSDTASFVEAAGCDQVLVLDCQHPLFDGEQILAFYNAHQRRSDSPLTVLTVDEEPSGLCWVAREAYLKLLEQGESCPLHNLSAAAEQLELRVLEYPAREAELLRPAQSCRDLLALSQAANLRQAERLMDQGVRFSSLDGVLLSPHATVGADTVIHAGTQLKGRVQIGSGCQIGPFTVVEDSRIGDGCTVHSSLIEKSVMGDGVRFGPNSHLRPNTVLGNRVKVGNFVEVKNSTLGEATSVAHLTYIGDSDFGAHINVGCGVVCVNYDGYEKHRCTVGDGAFIGCNSNLVAPVTVEEGAYTAAGSTITDRVPAHALAIARCRQENKEGWALRYREKHQKKGK